MLRNCYVVCRNYRKGFGANFCEPSVGGECRSERILVGRDRYISLQIRRKDDVTDKVRTMRRFMSAWLPPSDD